MSNMRDISTIHTKNAKNQISSQPQIFLGRNMRARKITLILASKQGMARNKILAGDKFFLWNRSIHFSTMI
jgi:hypothetical protein